MDHVYAEPVELGDGNHDSELAAINLTTRQSMMLGTDTHNEKTFHLLFSADIRGHVDNVRLHATLSRLTSRHEALRTIFVRESDGGLHRRVLRLWRPELIEQSFYVRTGGDPVEKVHGLLERASTVLLCPFERPPVVFVHTRICANRSVLSILIHQAIADYWSIGVLWREFADSYAADGDDVPAPSGALLEAEMVEPTQRALEQRLSELVGASTVVELPSDLDRPLAGPQTGARVTFNLSDEARHGCDTLVAITGLPRNTVLLAVWALVVARRAVVAEVVIGVAARNRPDPDKHRIIGAFMTVPPVRCSVAGFGTVSEYLDGIGETVRAALTAEAVSFEHLVDQLDSVGGDGRRNPVVQLAFAAYDEWIPARLNTADLSLTIHEGYCGGVRLDAILRVCNGAGGPHLALEYGTEVLRPDEATALIGAIDCTLIALAADPSGPLDDVQTFTAGERRRLLELGTGRAVDTETDVWHLIDACASRVPGRPAVRDARAAQALTYRQLIRAVEARSSALAAAGVQPGGCVGVAIRRSAQEIITVLAILRLGAAYVAIEPDVPSAVAGRMLDAAKSRIVAGDRSRLVQLGTALQGRQAIEIANVLPISDEGVSPPQAAEPDPARVAYVAFTSGSTGTPKGTQVPHRAIVRLVREPVYLLPGAMERFLRLAPLGFDLSTLEIFAPLTAGGCIEVYPDLHVVPDDFAKFIKTRGITGMWLTSGLFRLVADYCPDAFTGAVQVLTGGDVVPPVQVRRVLERCPGLRITNGYGPTENTTFTTVHHVDDLAEVDDPLPIGKPIPGTSLVVLGDDGRLVPPGCTGELYVYGDGLATGYASLPEETAAAFGYFSPEVSVRLYRTGDLVRWDAHGLLHFIGRRDRQVKIRGFRIELDGLARILRDHPMVRDAVVVATGPRAGHRRLLAGVVAPGAEQKFLGELRAFATERLPGYAVPALWVLVREFPVTVNGKLDVAHLEQVAGQAPTLAAAELTEAPATAVPPEPDFIEQAIASVWRDLLGMDNFGVEDRFFDIGGDSLLLLRVAARLHRRLPGFEITVQDLTVHQTITAIANHMRTHIQEPS